MLLHVGCKKGVTRLGMPIMLSLTSFPKKEGERTMKMIFVFGSNLAGRHGKGAALYALKHCGAVIGVGVGRTGNAYAIPTKDEHIRTLPLPRIAEYVAQFLHYAREHPELEFEVTKIGCGLAGYKEHQIAPMFIDAPKNCYLPDCWRCVPLVAENARLQDLKLCLRSTHG